MSKDVEADALVNLSMKRSDHGQIITLGGLSRKPTTSQPQESSRGSSRVMSTTESLSLLLDNTNGEIQGLEAENWRLREAHPEQVAEAELSTDVQWLKELYKAGTRGHPQERQAGRKEQTSTGRDDKETLEPGKGSCEVTLCRRLAAEVETATEPECTPRTTGSSSLVSAVVGK